MKVDNPYRKPHPFAFEQMSARLGVSPSACVYVADNPLKDFIAPNRLGWRTVQIKRLGGIYEMCAATPGGEPQHVIATLDELDRLLAG